MSRIHLRSLDFLKGIAMIAVICAHTSFWINDPEEMWLHGIFWMIFQFCGPAGFSVLTSVAVTISVKYKRTYKNMSDLDIFKNILKKALIFYAVGIFFVADFSGGLDAFLNPIYLTRIHIFQLIAISQVLTFVSLKLKKPQRILVVLLLILVDIFGYPIIVELMEQTTSIFPETFEGAYGYEALDHYSGWIYMLFFRMSLHMGIIPWIIIPFLASIGGEIIHDKLMIPAYENQTDKRSENDHKKSKKVADLPKTFEISHLKQLFLYSLILYIIGISFGLKLRTYFRGVEDLDWLNSGGGFTIERYPTFLFNGSWQSLVYCTAIVLAFIGIGLVTNDLTRNKAFSIFNIKENHDFSFFFKFWMIIRIKLTKFVNLLESLGKYSMTAFIVHFIIRGWHHYVEFPALISFPIMFAYAFLIAYIMYLWDHKLDGKYTFEKIISFKSFQRA
ncbi:MAG: hypothetical protein GF364_18050 [Candidatus Lokiarchaeota archaeon]|nr:hypothetical protein [Candidatus Lokiarchaeota archaeon]